jgi:large conductance mechanosensitive channel
MKEKIKKAAEGFKDFALKDALLGTAVGIMIGSALKDLITSLIDNILMPPIAFITSGIDFSELFIVIGKGEYDTVEAANEAGALIITYGEFINAFVSFLVLAIALYILTNVVVKQIQKKDEKKKKEKPTTKECPFCKTDIPIKAKRCPNCTSEL